MKQWTMIVAALAACTFAARAADKDLYGEIVKPIFDAKCTECHGEKKVKGKLRMDSYAALMKGGENGKCVKPGEGAKSLLYKGLKKPMNDDDHMPPKDKPQLDASEIAVIKWWIDKGAPEKMLVSAAGEIPADAKAAIDAAK